MATIKCLPKLAFLQDPQTLVLSVTTVRDGTLERTSRTKAQLIARSTPTNPQDASRKPLEERTSSSAKVYMFINN